VRPIISTTETQPVRPARSTAQTSDAGHFPLARHGRTLKHSQKSTDAEWVIGAIGSWIILAQSVRHPPSLRCCDRRDDPDVR
jgi:hypothetical protein